MEIGALELPDDQARALLASPDTMADIYKTFSRWSIPGIWMLVREHRGPGGHFKYGTGCAGGCPDGNGVAGKTGRRVPC